MTQEELQKNIREQLDESTWSISELMDDNFEQRLTKKIVEIINQHVAEVIGEDISGLDMRLEDRGTYAVQICDCGHVLANQEKVRQRERAKI